LISLPKLILDYLVYGSRQWDLLRRGDPRETAHDEKKADPDNVFHESFGTAPKPSNFAANWSIFQPGSCRSLTPGVRSEARNGEESGESNGEKKANKKRMLVIA